jgi:hypothetical protein
MKNAVIAAIVASIVASGSAVAATTLIDGHSIKDRSIPAIKLTSEAIASLAGATGPQGLQGPRGLQGAQGVAGAKGDPGPPGATSITVVQGPDVTVGASSAGSATAHCPNGVFAVAGGFQANQPVFVLASQPGNGDPPMWYWTVSIVNPSSTNSVTLHAYATCATSNATN